VESATKATSTSTTAEETTSVTAIVEEAHEEADSSHISNCMVCY
jgi:hypothetical protein